jgi:2-polyprenyl-6-methoxyphenol hydroxylase-like FAD-dependent oxidoreductase
MERMGAGRIHLGHRCVGVEQDAHHATLRFQSSAGIPMASVEADIVVACDGVNSMVRRAFYPNEKLAFGGINT